MNPIRIAIVDDHDLVRSGLRKLLESCSDMRVVGEAATGLAALELVRTTQPEVVLMDVALKGESGLDVTAELSQKFPETRVIVLSMFAAQAFVQQAQRAGAAGYLVKDRSFSQLEAAIREVTNGASFVGGLEFQHSNGTEGWSPLADLTSRQVEILRLVALGRSSREIAANLFIAEKTVEHHRSNIRRALGVADTAGMILFAVRQGIVSPDEVPLNRSRHEHVDPAGRDKSS